MTSTFTAAETSTDAPNAEAPANVPPAPTGFPVPDAEGNYPIDEAVRIEGLPVKCAGEIYITQVGERDFVTGWFLLMKQPANTSKVMPGGAAGMHHVSRALALKYVIDEVAAKFFHDHKAAMERLTDWRADVMLVEQALEKSEQRADIQQTWAPATVEFAAAPEAVVPTSRYDHIPVDSIDENPHNPRTDIAGANIEELAESIKAQGFLIQAIAVIDVGNGRKQLIAGWRRWQAHRHLKWPTIEAKIFTGVSPAHAEELALVENLQRNDLNPMEEARGFAGLRDRHGYTIDRIHERTGKAVTTIYAALGLLRLASTEQAMVQSKALAVGAAKVLTWERWATRPQHSAVLAAWIVRESLSVREVEKSCGEVLSTAAAAVLEAAKLAVNVSDFRARLAIEEGGELIKSADGALWHLAPSQWKEEKKQIKAEMEAEDEAAADRAKARAETAIAGHVNVKVQDLRTGELAHVPLMGSDARYRAHLPAGSVIEGLDKNEKEIVVCLNPEALKALQVREAELLKADVEAKLPALLDRATAAIKRIKKVGPRELALVVDALTARWTAFDGKAFSLLGVKVPETQLSRHEMSLMEPVDLARVVMLSAVLNTKGGELFGVLRWVLETDDLGLAEEDDERWSALLASAAAEVFARSAGSGPAAEPVTDPVMLAQWARAHGLGMAVAEIARSSGATEADVSGALGLKK